MKRFFSFIIAVMLVGQVWAQTTFTVDGLKYIVIYGDNVSVAKGSKELSGAIEIPSKVTYPKNHGKTYTVTSIGNEAFKFCSITSVTIPESVTSINDQAFEDCIGLTSVTIPNSVTAIGRCAFRGCIGLTSVTIGYNVTSIGIAAFRDCSGLTSVSIPKSVISIEIDAFSGCSSLQSITLPFVGDKAHSSTDTYQYPFGYIFGEVDYDGGTATTQSYYGSSTSSTTETTYYIPTSLKEVILTGSEHITKGAFENCSGLTSVVVPNTVTSISEGAFSGCSSLESITLPFVGDRAHTPDDTDQYPFGYIFGPDSYEGGQATYAWNCVIPSEATYFIPESLKDVVITGSNYIQRAAFDFCQNITSVTLPNTVKSIGEMAFRHCWKLTSVNIPNSVTSLGWWAFYDCHNLTSINIPNSVTSIGDQAFFLCESITSLSIGNGVKSIGSEAFRCCTSLTSVTIPNSVTTIGDFAFAYCDNLTSVTIGNSVENFGMAVFYKCSKLREISIDSDNANLTYEGGVLFNKDKTTIVQFIVGTMIDSRDVEFNIEIPNSVINIGKGAFAYCERLFSVYIPNSVTTIGDLAFYNCPYLMHGGYPIKSCDSYKMWFIIPNSVTSIGELAFGGCEMLQNITIPNSIISIGKGAFDGCRARLFCECEKSQKPAEWLTFSGYSVVWNCKILNVTHDDEYGYVNNVNTDGFVVEPEYGSIWYLNGATATLTARPNDDCHFVKWSDGSTENPHTITMSESKTYTAVFRPKSFVIDGLKYTTNADNNNVEVHANSHDLSGDIEIPEKVTYDGVEYTVTSIGAFFDCRDLSSVTIPNSVTSIGSWAFSDCSSLSSVTIGNSVTSIGDNAFYDCKRLTSIEIPISVISIGECAFLICGGLTSVTIPNSVTSIGDDAFGDCWRLTEINVESDNTKYTSQDGILFNKDKTAIICYPAGKTETTYTIPNTVTNISRYTFDGCSSLTSVTISNSVTSIGKCAFLGCRGLTSIVIPNSVTSIGKMAFDGCSSLTSVTIGNSVTNIGERAFAGCNGLTSITIPNSVTSIGERVFDGCSNATIYCECAETLKPSEWDENWNSDGGTVKWGCKVIRAVANNSDGSITTDGENYAVKDDDGSLWYLAETENGTATLTAIPNNGYHVIWNNNITEKTLSLSVTESKTYTATFEAHVEDSIEIENFEAATCTTVGSYDSVVYCSICQAELFREEKEVPALGHTYSNSVTAPTCTEVGFTTHTCSVCKHTYNSDTVAANGHTEVIDSTIAATCSKAGKTEGKHCSVCNAVIVAQEEVAALGHTEVVDAAIAATCTNAGKTEGKHCSVCNEILVARTEIPALGHKFKDYVYNNDATTTADGTETATCSRCGEKDTRIATGTKLPEPEKGTAVAESAANEVNIYAHGNIIVIVNAADEINVYNAMGALVCRDATPCVRMEIPVTAPGVYIVKTGSVVKRVMINEQ